jgi:hypothetical protein
MADEAQPRLPPGYLPAETMARFLATSPPRCVLAECSWTRSALLPAGSSHVPAQAPAGGTAALRCTI